MYQWPGDEILLGNLCFVSNRTADIYDAMPAYDHPEKFWQGYLLRQLKHRLKHLLQWSGEWSRAMG